MGPFFGFPPLKSSRPLHKIIRVQRVEGGHIPQLVRKTVDQFVISSSSDSSDNHTGTNRYFHLAFLQLTLLNTILSESLVGQRGSQVQRPASDLKNYASEHLKQVLPGPPQKRYCGCCSR
jgi:hypothetical protein